MPHALTPLQYDIARMYACGLSHADTAARTGATLTTVNSTVSRLRRKLGVSSRREMAAAILACHVREWDGGGRPSGHGYVRGGTVQIIGGRFAGRDGVYVGAANSTQVRVQVGGGVFSLRAKYCEPMEQAA